MTKDFTWAFGFHPSALPAHLSSRGVKMSNQLLFLAGVIVTFIFGAGALIHGLVNQGDSSSAPREDPESDSES